MNARSYLLSTEEQERRVWREALSRPLQRVFEVDGALPARLQDLLDALERKEVVRA